MDYNVTAYTTEDPVLKAFATFWYDFWMTGNFIVESIAVPASLITSILIIIVLCFIKQGIAKSAKIYYFTLAVMDFFAIFGYHFLLSYLDEDLRYLSGNTVFVAIEIHNILCQSIYFTLRESEHTANWMYMVLCIEKLIAVEKPLVARNKFTKKWSIKVVLVCLVTGLPLDIMCVMTFGPYYYPVWNVTYCTILGTVDDNVAMFVHLYIAFTTYFLPSCATIITGGLLLKSVVVHTRGRKKLTADSKTPSSKAGLNGAVTVLIMAGIHTALFLPLGILSVWSVPLLFDRSSDLFMTYSVTYIFWLLWNTSALAHCTNFFIYILRIPQFRRKFLCQRAD